jgi:hypothetical protein
MKDNKEVFIEQENIQKNPALVSQNNETLISKEQIGINLQADQSGKNPTIVSNTIMLDPKNAFSVSPVTTITNFLLSIFVPFVIFEVFILYLF